MSLLAVTSGNIASGVVSAEGVDFDGTYDYLSRSTDLVGNVDSKTFTFSCWVYPSKLQTALYWGGNTSSTTKINIKATIEGAISIVCTNSTNTTIFYGGTSNNILPLNTMSNLLISVDLTNTSNRKIYLNDIDITSKFTFYYHVNDFIDFTLTYYRVGCNRVVPNDCMNGRLSNLFLDYTYRDLSVEANRRLFITADGKPTPTATLKALNPILYLPMKDAATAHINEGTGGNFTANGTFATSNRGANQDNCVASKFDGVDDYLSRTSLSGIVNGKQFTFSYVTTPLNTSTNIQFRTSSSYVFYINISSGRVTVVAKNAGGTIILDARTPTNGIANLNTYNSINISCDLSVLNKINILINGIPQSLTINTFTNDNVNWTGTTLYQIGRNDVEVVASILGELYFETAYYDLSVYNPFWIED